MNVITYPLKFNYVSRVPRLTATRCSYLSCRNIYRLTWKTDANINTLLNDIQRELSLSHRYVSFKVLTQMANNSSINTLFEVSVVRHIVITYPFRF